MPLARYGVLKARPIDRRLGVDNRSPHYQIRTVAQDLDHRIAINVKSQQAPSEVLYLIDEHFHHPMTDLLAKLEMGFHELESNPSGGGLDFIRGNILDPMKMVPLPQNVPGPDNDLNEKIDGVTQRALADESAHIYAFGQEWGPEASPDKYFGFRPNRGIHDIHMNQGNSGRFTKDNGVWQDGGLLFHFPNHDQWIAVFLAFQSQIWHTDDHNGNPLMDPPSQPGEDTGIKYPRRHKLPTADLPDGLIRIVGAVVNSSSSPEKESVMILNTSNREIDLSGWALADKLKNKMSLEAKLAAGDTLKVDVKLPMVLSNKGGIITVLDDMGRKVHGVSYTHEQAKHIDWTIAFR